jgi:nucleoside-diphosphate-sugar epimerase
MKLLLTGASSFTGHWFAEALLKAGHDVVAPLRGSLDSGADARRAGRLRRLTGKAELIPDCAFGSPRFMEIAGGRDFDVLCHHAAEVGNYRSPDFDIAGAVAHNTLNLRAVLEGMARRGLKGVVLTGSFFEQDEGAGSQPLAAFSAYGVSKGVTADVVRHRCHEIGMRYGKFVVPHPFGPLEQPRLGAYLAKTWGAGGVAEIATPAYVRDNIHVGLVAARYARFVGETPEAPPARRSNPSGYVETQGAFVERIAREIGPRLGIECRVKLMTQKDFPEPLVRINTEPAARCEASWSEEQAWEEYAEWTREVFTAG